MSSSSTTDDRSGARPWYNSTMWPNTKRARRPRFRRVAEPPRFRITEGDLAIIRAVAGHRFLRSTQIARLVGRSQDRTNRRLLFLFHAGYLDRPRAQLDRFPVDGSAHMVYALADAGARLLQAHESPVSRNDRSSKNRSALRPFIEHQLAISEFQITLHEAVLNSAAVTMLGPNELVAAFPDTSKMRRTPTKLDARLSVDGRMINIAVIPDTLVGLRFSDGSRRCFAVEIDRGTMPVTRSNINETSFALKMRAYLAAYAASLHEQRYGWKAFRVLTVTTDHRRMQTMIDALRKVPMPRGPGATLFFFTTQDQLRCTDPLRDIWHDGTGRAVALI
jgi:hypothetical protein